MICFCIALMSINIMACKKDDNNAPVQGTTSLNDLIKQDASLSVFAAILKKTHLDVYTTGLGPFTVFAPTNNAYKQVGINSVDDLVNYDSTYLLARTSFLIAAGVKSSSNLVGLNVPITTIANTTLAASALPDSTYFNGLSAFKRDISASNGMLHVMNNYLLPNANNTSQMLLLFPDTYKLFSQAIARASSGATIVNATTTTLFAPTNAAMIAAGLDSLKITQTTAANLANIVKYHVLSTKYYVFALKTGDMKTAQGKNVTLNIGKTVSTVRGLNNSAPANFTNFYLTPYIPFATFSSVNLSTLNGVIHTIDKVLAP